MADHSKDELLATIADLNEALRRVEARRDDRDWLEGALRRRTKLLSERMKELDCIHALLRLSTTHVDPLAGHSREILRAIRNGWQNPEAARVRIQCDGRAWSSPGSDADGPKLIEPIVVRGTRRGEIEIGYPDGPSIGPDPFLAEEAELLRSIALWLALVIEKRDLADAAGS